jgi:hypothetical protein
MMDMDLFDSNKPAPLKKFLSFKEFKGFAHVDNIKNKYRIGKILG